MRRILFLIAGIGLSLTQHAQQKNFSTKDHGFVHSASKQYEWPTDPKVLKKLDEWQDRKFGIMFHWGVYSVPESRNHGHFARKTNLRHDVRGFVRAQPMEISRNGIGNLQIPLILPSLNLPNGLPL